MKVVLPHERMCVGIIKDKCYKMLPINTPNDGQVSGEFAGIMDTVACCHTCLRSPSCDVWRVEHGNRCFVGSNVEFRRGLFQPLVNSDDTGCGQGAVAGGVRIEMHEVAQGKPVMQSSTNGQHWANLANDNDGGRTTNIKTCSLTAVEHKPWLRVDLLQVYRIDTIELYAIAPHFISVHVHRGYSQDSEVPCSQMTPLSASKSIQCPANTFARFRFYF